MTTKEVYTHFSVPLNVAYKIKLSRHFFISPGIGVSCSYNSSARERETDQSGTFVENSSNHELSATEFNDKYNRMSLWAGARVYGGYAVNRRLSVIAGPEVQYMVSSLLKNTESYQRNIAGTFNAGVVLSIY